MSPSGMQQRPVCDHHIYPCIKAYIAHTNIQISEQKGSDCLNIFATSKSICEVFFKYSKNFLNLGTGEKGEEGRLRVKGERLKVKQTPPSCGHLPLIGEEFPSGRE